MSNQRRNEREVWDKLFTWMRKRNDGQLKLDDSKLTRINLHGANLEGANLRGANLRGARISEAIFRGADLFEADLSYADLSYADFSYAQLEECDFSSSSLYGAKMYRSDCTHATFNSADCQFANFEYSNLRYADFGNAHINYCSFHYADLLESGIGANLINSTIQTRGVKGVLIQCVCNEIFIHYSESGTHMCALRHHPIEVDELIKIYSMKKWECIPEILEALIKSKEWFQSLW